ncbi:hypothetical protein AB3K92_04320 [Burkholderia sp. Bmkn7]|uniref:hypothetical protein n=1 Tax=Burkholderia sp. Bmkn7 TaxID=3236841 RepID=UPI0034E598BB
MSFATLALAGQHHTVEAAMQASPHGFGVMPVKGRRVSSRIAKLLAVAWSLRQMTTEREALASRNEARQECLRPLRQSKAAHASLEFALGLMTVLGAAAHARSRSDENMLTLASSG